MARQGPAEAPLVARRRPPTTAARLHSPGACTAVKQRMKSVANIQKITKAMKMVAASKMRSAQVRSP